MTEFDEAFGQDVQHQPPNELIAGERHALVLGAVGVVLVGEGDGASCHVECENTMIGDPDPVGVTGEIGQDGFGSGKGALGVDHEVFLGRVLEEIGKSERGRVGRLLTVELKFAS